MASKLFDQVGGVISLSLNGKNPEKLMNLALSRGIYLWDIKKEDDRVYLKVRKSGFDALKVLAEESGIEISVLDRQGLPFYKQTLQRRIGFLGGLFLFIIALYFLSSFIWFLEVSGNQKVNTVQILDSAARHGLYRGAAKWNFQRREVEKAMLRDLPQIAYIQLDVRGVKTEIRVVEKILPGEDIHEPCHIVARKDGVVQEVLVLKGQANVEPGQAVAKGDILISGIVFPSSPSPFLEEEETEVQDMLPYAVRARGQVKARTWYEGYGECKLRVDKKVFTGEQHNQWYLLIPGKQYLIKGGKKADFNMFTRTEKRKAISTPWGPIGFSRVLLKEQTIESIEYEQEQAIKMAREKALKELRGQYDRHAEVLASHTDILSSPGDSMVRLKITTETLEDIGIAKPINSVEVGH